MSNYKIELERTERQDLEIKKHISDVKEIVKSKVNKDVSGLNSIKELLKNETLGGYIVDDIIKVENLKFTNFVPNYGGYTHSWTFTGHTKTIRSIALDTYNNVYSCGDDKKVIKASVDGEKIWEFSENYQGVMDIAVNSNGYIYSCSGDTRVVKISPSGEKVWEFGGHSKWLDAIALDKDGNIYSGGSDSKIIKISPSGSKIWEKDFGGSISEIKVDKYDNMYVCHGGSFTKMNSNRDVLWTLNFSDDVNAVDIDEEYNVFLSLREGKVVKFTKDGEKVWEFNGHTGYVQKVRLDADGYVYSSSVDKKVMKITPNGEKVWEFSGHNNRVYALTVSSGGDVYSGCMDARIIKNVLKREPLGYKVLRVERG